MTALGSMEIAVVGLSHRTAAFDVLERVGAVVRSVARELSVEESVVVLTCNRAEVWTAGQPCSEALVQRLAAAANAPVSELLPHIYMHSGMDAARHAMRVSAGIESLMLGEAEILGQLARALESARKLGTAGPLLTRLFLAAVQAGKRARSETEVSRHTVSVSQAAASVALDVVGTRAPRALIVGAGEAAELAARALRGRGVSELTVIGRTADRGRALSQRLDARTRPWTELRAGIAESDIVISATAAREPVIGRGEIDERDGRVLAVVDLAIPYDVDPAVSRVPGVTRIDLDSLRSFVDAGLARREAAVPAVEAIIEDELERFRTWLEGRRVVPLITELREYVIGVIRTETRETLKRLGHHDAAATADHLAERVATKVLHEPVVRLKAQAARDGATPHLAAIRDLFALSTPAEGRE